MIEEEPDQKTYKYKNQYAQLEVFAQQSQNGELVIGSIIAKTKKYMLPITFQVQFKGVYKVYQISKRNDLNSTQSNMNVTETLSDLQNQNTKRNDKLHMLQSLEGLQVQQCFLEGIQKLTQISERSQISPDSFITYPFLFNVPPNAPSSAKAIWFANKRIQIHYFLRIKGFQQKQKIPFVNFQLKLKVRQAIRQSKSQLKITNVIQYRCFTRFFCRCLGTYHIEVSANVLHPGQVQLEGRIFREGKKTQKIISQLDLILMGEMKNLKKMVIGRKKMMMKHNQFEMLQGQVLLSYDPNLRSFTSQLITINFWIQCKVEFSPKVWKFVKKQITLPLLL